MNLNLDFQILFLKTFLILFIIMAYHYLNSNMLLIKNLVNLRKYIKIKIFKILNHLLVYNNFLIKQNYMIIF